MQVILPAQDLVFQILSSRMMIAARWDRSPVSLKMFILAFAGFTSSKGTQTSSVVCYSKSEMLQIRFNRCPTLFQRIPLRNMANRGRRGRWTWPRVKLQCRPGTVVKRERERGRPAYNSQPGDEHGNTMWSNVLGHLTIPTQQIL